MVVASNSISLTSGEGFSRPSQMICAWAVCEELHWKERKRGIEISKETVAMLLTKWDAFICRSSGRLLATFHT